VWIVQLHTKPEYPSAAERTGVDGHTVRDGRVPSHGAGKMGLTPQKNSENTPSQPFARLNSGRAGKRNQQGLGRKKAGNLVKVSPRGTSHRGASRDGCASPTWAEGDPNGRRQKKGKSGWGHYGTCISNAPALGGGANALQEIKKFFPGSKTSRKKKSGGVTRQIKGDIYWGETTMVKGGIRGRLKKNLSSRGKKRQGREIKEVGK